MIGKKWLKELRQYFAGSCAALAIAAGTMSVCQAQEAVAPAAAPLLAMAPAETPLPEIAPAAPARDQAAQQAAQAALQAQVEDQRRKIEILQQQIEEMKRLSMNRAQQPVVAAAQSDAKIDEAEVKRLVEALVKEQEAKKKAEEELKKAQEKAQAEAEKAKKEEEGYQVGTELGVSVKWASAPGRLDGLMFETPNRDFWMHIGGRLMWETVTWNESPSLKDSSFGELQDGAFFRRIRLQLDGEAWSVMEYNFIIGLEQVQQSVPDMDEMWVGIKDIPWIGAIRAGHIKTPYGLEGDEASSSNAMDFLEKSASADAFLPNFGTGVELLNSFFDQHMTYQSYFYRQDNYTNGNNGTDFGNGKYAWTGRVTFLPYISDDGSCFLHLGQSLTWREAEVPDPGLVGNGVIRFRARPDFRDAIGDFGTTVNGVTLPGNTSRLVDTGNIQGESTMVVGEEVWWNHGPFALQGEWLYAQANDTEINGKKTGDIGFSGGYIMATYFLTGESRDYDRRLGRYATDYVVGPTTPFWLVRDEDNNWNLGWGAWEVLVRYDYLNLNDRQIQGGVLGSLDIGINWFLNRNLKIQFEYCNDNRWHEAGQPSGLVQGFGTNISLAF